MMVLAWHLASSGRRVAVVERRYIGGSCPNINCLPSKNEIWSAKVADLLRHAARFGVVTGSVAVDMARVRQRKREMVEGLIALHLDLYKKSGAELIMGNGRFVAPKTLEIRLRDGGTRVLRGERVFLNLGTRPTIPATPGLAGQAAHEHRGAGTRPFARAPDRARWRLRRPRVRPGLPPLRQPRDGGPARASAARPGGPRRRGRPRATLRRRRDRRSSFGRGTPGRRAIRRRRAPPGADASRRGVLEGSDLLAATGRTPNTAGIGLDTLGVRLDGRGYVQVNDRLETTAPDVWAMGECAGSPQFTHVSEDDFRVIRDNLAGGADRRATGSSPSACSRTPNWRVSA
jgi:pyruvate/2-oxoglutarate dehydrogenase complex dihydrolipoamide dehydrogenase (E3) component